MRKATLSLALAGMVITGIIGIGVGYYLTPEYKLGMYDKYDMDLGTADRWLDLRYLNAMIAHHRGAMLLAEQAQRITQRKEIRDLAENILSDEPSAIQELYNWKQEWYDDTRSVRDPVITHLGSYDETFDLRFLNALIAHHEAGLRMTADISRKSSRSDILNNANTVDAFLTSTLPILIRWRTEWYGI